MFVIYVCVQVLDIVRECTDHVSIGSSPIPLRRGVLVFLSHHSLDVRWRCTLPEMLRGLLCRHRPGCPSCFTCRRHACRHTCGCCAFGRLWLETALSFSSFCLAFLQVSDASSLSLGRGR